MESDQSIQNTFKELWPYFYNKLSNSEKIAQLEKEHWLNRYSSLNNTTNRTLPSILSTSFSTSPALSISLNLTNQVPETSYSYTDFCLNNLNSQTYSSYANTYELCLERERLLKEKLDLEEKLLLSQKLESIQSNLEVEEKVKILHGYIKMEQRQIERENLLRSKENMIMNHNGLNYDYFNYLNDSPGRLFYKTEALIDRRSIEEQAFFSNVSLRPNTDIVQSSRQNSCFQKSIDALTNELYEKQARRENPWKL